MSPWKRSNNPFDEYPENEPKKFNPETMVEVICPGCNKPINIRIRKEDNGRRIIRCHNCETDIEVNVFSSRSVTVHAQNKDGSNRRQIPYEKVWQE